MQNRKTSDTRHLTDSWITQLAKNLSQGSDGIHPVQTSEYVPTCTTLGSNAYSIESSGHGICMQNFNCAYKYCAPAQPFNLPNYTIDVRSESDIQLALAAAVSLNKTVSIKSTGHSFTGSSTFNNSIMLWLHNYPKNGTIVKNYTDSCKSVHDAVISINAGEIWDDILESVGDQYHVVTGGGRSVGTIGGWLQGGGMSFSSRTYGLGVDQVVDLRVVLANGTIVQADACTNSDLFWALRGGGGGTFGVAVNAHYKLHPVTPVQRVNWEIGGVDYAYTHNPKGLTQVITQWINFWVRKSPTLDNRWGGFFFQNGASLLFMGSLEDETTSFINEFDSWYYNTLNISNFEVGKWGAFPPSYYVTSYNSWYDYKGGKSAYKNPNNTDQTGSAYASSNVTNFAARLAPQSIVEQQPDKIAAFLLDLISNGQLPTINYFLGGAINNVSTTATSVHPGMRKAIWSLYTNGVTGHQKVRDFFPNNVTGVDFNHHYVLEPHWTNACW